MKSFDVISYYSFPTNIFFGKNARSLAPSKLREAGCFRPLLVTDRSLAPLHFITEIKMMLEKTGGEPKEIPINVEVFSDIWGNPVESQIQSGVYSYQNANCDSVIAVGGGAVLDSAKAILLMAKHLGHLFDYEDGKEDSRSIDPTAIPYFLAIPTTAGTGSEVGRSAVISDDVTKAKKIIYSPALLPQAVLADPELTVQLPTGVTASTGMDALTHCIEAYLAKGFHPICDGIALEGIALISKSLEKCVYFSKQNELFHPQSNGHSSGDISSSEDTSSLEEQIYYRGLMLNAAMMGAIAFQKGLGVTHSCAHALSTIYDLHHGLANGIMLPYAMCFNAEKEKDRFDLMKKSAGVNMNFIDWIISLQKNIGIPEKLSALEIEKEEWDSRLDTLVDFAFQDVCHQLNPREVTKEDFKKLYQNAFSGVLKKPSVFFS